MSWKSPETAIIATALSGATSLVEATSTATICLESTWLTTKLRMFGINAKLLNKEFSSTPFSDLDSGAATPYYSVQTYLDSDSSGVFAPNADVDPSPTVKTGVPFQTSLGVDDGGAPVPYLRIESRAAVGGKRWESVATLQWSPMYVIYKDPHVVAVPAELGGGWLMLLGRYSIPANDERLRAVYDNKHAANSNYTEYDAAAEVVDLGAGYSLSDIIAFWAPTDPSFSAPDVKGPYKLQGDLLAVRDPYQSALHQASIIAFRAWIGVPGAAFVDGKLYLWYSAVPNQVRTNDTTGGTGALAGEVYIDVDADFDACVADYEGGQGFSASKTFVAVYEQEDLDQLFGADPVDERTWLSAQGEIPSSLRFPIRVLSAVVGGSVGDVTSLASVITARLALYKPTFTGAVDPWYVDATPYYRLGNLCLLLSVQPAPEGGGFTNQLEADGVTGYGVYRCRAVPEGAALTTGTSIRFTYEATFGRDWVIAWDGLVGELSADLVVATFNSSPRAEDAQVFKDPDGVLVDDGLLPRIICYSSPGVLQRSDGTLSTIEDESWTAAWFTLPVPALRRRSAARAERRLRSAEDDSKMAAQPA